MSGRLRPGKWFRADRGAVAIEFLILAPILMVLIDLATYAGCVALARAVTHRAAEIGTRGQTIARSGADSAQGSANATLVESGQKFGIKCSGSQADTTPYGVPVGTPSTVTFVVHCAAGFPGIAVLGFPSQITVSEITTEPLDIYRWRTQ